MRGIPKLNRRMNLSAIAHSLRNAVPTQAFLFPTTASVGNGQCPEELAHAIRLWSAEVLGYLPQQRNRGSTVKVTMSFLTHDDAALFRLAF